MRRGLTVLLVFTALAARAAADDLALIVAPPQAEFASRIRGQIGDLPWSSRVVDETAGSSDRLDGALERGEREGARVVIWMERTPRRIRVFIVEVPTEHVFSRAITIEAEESESAAWEGAALVVRSALTTLARGGTIGVAAGPAEIEWRLAANAAIAVDGAAPRANLGPGIAAGVAIGEFEVWLEARTGIDERIAVGGARLSLWRVQTQLRGAWRVHADRDWELVLGVALGGGGYHRTTERVDSMLMATPPTLSPHLAGSVSGQLRLWFDASPLAIELGVSVDTIVPSPHWRIQSGSTESAGAAIAPWPIQPGITLGFVLRGS